MKRMRLSILMIAAASALLAAPGCYTRVTKAKGIGADYSHPDRYESSKPKIDQLIDNATGRD